MTTDNWSQTLLRRLHGGPTYGLLLDLGAANYAILRRLVPALPTLGGRLSSHGPGQLPLYLDILEQTRYSTLLRLTHLFADDQPHGIAEPDLVMRAYHDAKQLEVLGLREGRFALGPSYQKPALENKWVVHTFVFKWLKYCEGRLAAFDISEPADKLISSAPNAGAVD